MELITAPFNLANVYHSIHPAPASPVSGTWDTLLMLFLRATTSARLLALIQEMTAFTLTKAVPKAFIHHLSGAAYIKSGGKKGQASAYVQQLVESDRHRHYMAAEHAKGGGGGGSGGGGGGGGGGGYGGSGGFQTTGVVRSDDDEEDYHYDDVMGNVGGGFVDQNAGSLAPDLIKRWRTREAQDENGACWDRSSAIAYDILWRRMHQTILSGENHNTSHIKENMEYHVKSIVCRKLNPEINQTSSASTTAASDRTKTKYNGNMRRTGLTSSSSSLSVELSQTYHGTCGTAVLYFSSLVLLSCTALLVLLFLYCFCTLLCLFCSCC